MHSLASTRGLQPCGSLRCGLAPPASSTITTASLLLRTARCSGVVVVDAGPPPMGHTLAPRRSSTSATFACPWYAA